MKKITLFMSFLFASAIGIAQPTTNATLPTRAAADVTAVYNSSSTYTNNVSDLNPNWGQSGFATNNTAFTNGGTISPVINYTNFNYQGINIVAGGNPPGVNVAAMEYIHLDIWSSSLTSVRLVPIQNAGPEEGFAIPITSPGTWISVDIPVTAFPATNFGGIRQLKFDTAAPGNGLSFFVDNIYFWKTPLAPGSDATLSDLKVDGVTVPGFGPGVVNYTYELVVGTTVVPQITSATTTDTNATLTTTTQASAIPGSASVLVTSQNGLVTKAYTVNFVATIPNQSPTPSTPNAEVLKLYGDTGGFTNSWVKDYDFGSFDSKLDLDLTAGVNEAIKMNFAFAGYGEGTNTVTDISAYNWVHFDYFADSNSNEIRFILIKNNGGVTEHSYELTPSGSNGTLVQNSWQSVNIPLSFFEGIGFDKTKFFQFKLGASSDLVSKIVYFDNIYFSVNQGTVLSANNFNVSIFSAYPNPTNYEWNIDATQNINSIKVFDISGKQILALNPNASSAVINASDLSSGIYFANIETDNGSKVVKLVKN